MTGRRRALVVVVAWLGLGAAPTVVRADDWTSQGFDAAHGRASGEISGASFAAGRWDYQFDTTDPSTRMIVAAPAAAHGILVVAGSDGSLRALRAVDGALLWRFQAKDGIQASPTIAAGKVFAASFDGQLHGLRLVDGQPLWERDLGGIEYSSPTVAEDSVFIAGGYPLRQIFRVEAATGASVWEAGANVLAQFSNSSPVVAGQAVIVGAMQGHYYSFDLATGAPAWSADTDGIVNLSSPVVHNGSVYAFPGGSSAKLHAIDASSGQAIPGWPLELSPPNDNVTGKVVGRQQAISSPAFAGDLLLLAVRFDEYIDTDKDSAADTFLMREFVVAIDTARTKVAWMKPNATLQVTSVNSIPKMYLVPSPAVFGAGGGAFSVAVASSLASGIAVWRASDGATLWTGATAGPTRSSPIIANGRLFVATDGGSVHAFLSDVNQPPMTPQRGLAPVDGQAVSSAGAAIRWGASMDYEADAVSYEVRIGSDTDLLETWQFRLLAPPGQTHVDLPSSLRPGTTYHYAIRARDSRGAWSEWSATQSFTVDATPPVVVNGQAQPNLNTALQGAVAGDVVALGAGTFHLGSELHVPAGVSLQGAGAARTILDGGGAAVAVTLDGDGSKTPAEVSGVQISGASTGLVISRPATTVHHVVVTNNRDVGISVSATGEAEIRNITAVGNGTGIRIFGSATVRNSIVVDNDVGLAGAGAIAASSRYNNLHGNRHAAYESVASGEGDLAVSVVFRDRAAGDFRLPERQATTDLGDPSDDFAQEPAPNGGRINLGAFGNTAEAETSAADPDQPPAAPSPTASAGATATAAGSGGCAIALAVDGKSPGKSPASSDSHWLALVLLLVIGTRGRVLRSRHSKNAR